MNDRIKHLKESKLLNILLSVLIACVVWIYVVDEVNPSVDDTIRNVPVTLHGQDVLESKGLMVTQQSVDDLDLQLTGKRNALMALTNKNITVTADVSSITAEGSYNLLCSIVLPSSTVSGTVTVDERDTYRITVTVEERVEKTVQVEGVLSGSIAEGYRAEEFILSPSQIEISGPSSLIESIEHARVTLTGNNLKESYSGLLSIELVSFDDQLVNSDQVKCEAASIYAVCPVVMVKEVDLTVEVVSGGGATEEDVSVDIFPESITVSGDEKDLMNLNEISLGSIRLAEISSNSIVLCPIVLPDGVKNEDGAEEANVTVKFEGLTSRTLEADRFELVNVPEGYSAEMSTLSLPVLVRGPGSAVEAVRADQLKVVVNLAGIVPEEGEMQVPAQVIMVQETQAGVVGVNYTVQITLSK